ncbi:MAG TPA: cytochrome c oxidase assembly protein [Acidisarcina sp.]
MYRFNPSALCLSEQAVDVLRTALLHKWSWPILPLISLVLGTVIYLRGWAFARRTRAAELSLWRPASFLAGAASLWIAIASPLDAFDDYLLTAHMIQHFILMSVAPPLLVLSAPVVPLLRGLPRWVVRWPLHWFFTSRAVRYVLNRLGHPAVIWVAMNVAYLGWHAPKAFELTFRSEGWHNLEHLCFFLTSLAFWLVVIEPWPAKTRWPRWAAIPYLLSADLLNTVLSGLLTFSGRVLYPSYQQAPRVCGLTALQDQIAAGSEMWVLNSTVFLIPAIVLTVHLLSPKIYRQRQVELTG